MIERKSNLIKVINRHNTWELCHDGCHFIVFNITSCILEGKPDLVYAAIIEGALELQRVRSFFEFNGMSRCIEVYQRSLWIVTIGACYGLPFQCKHTPINAGSCFSDSAGL